MFNTNFLNALVEGRAISLMAFIKTVMGFYVYAEYMPTLSELGNATDGDFFLDGDLILDGSWGFSGEFQVIDVGSRVLSFENIEETISPDSGDLIGALKTNEITQYQLPLNNADWHFSAILAIDSFLGATLQIFFGFRGLHIDDYISLFSGVVTEQVREGTVLDLTTKKI